VRRSREIAILAAERAHDRTRCDERRQLVLVPSVYRIVAETAADHAYSGLDTADQGGRWTLPGEPVVYAADSISLAAFEALVHLREPPHTRRWVVVRAVIPPDLPIERCHQPPTGWQARPPVPVSQRRGSRWLRNARSAVLTVPSVIFPSQRNFLLSPGHRDFGRIRVGRPVPFRFDPRLRFSPNREDR
jgi:RES domain-containing protein